MPKTNRRGNPDNYYPRSDNHFLGKNPEEVQETEPEIETEEVEFLVEIPEVQPEPEPVPEIKEEVKVPVVKSNKPKVFRCPVCGFADGRFQKSDSGRRVICRNCSNHIVVNY